MAQQSTLRHLRRLEAHQRPRHYYPSPRVAAITRKSGGSWLKYGLVELGLLIVLGILVSVAQPLSWTNTATIPIGEDWTPGYGAFDHSNIGPPPPVNMSDMGLILGFEDQGLPISTITNYMVFMHPSIDVRKPNQPTQQSVWHDTRLPARDDYPIQVINGGGIEIWPDNAGAQKRMDYLQLAGKYVPAMLEYDYVRRNVLLRLSNSLTPDQAMAYVKALERMLMKWH